MLAIMGCRFGLVLDSITAGWAEIFQKNVETTCSAVKGRQVDNIKLNIIHSMVGLLVANIALLGKAT